MAKLGSVSDKNFYERISELIQDKAYSYPDEIFPPKILSWIKRKKINYSNASKYIGVINSDGTGLKQLTGIGVSRFFSFCKSFRKSAK